MSLVVTVLLSEVEVEVVIVPVSTTVVDVEVEVSEVEDVDVVVSEVDEVVEEEVVVVLVDDEVDVDVEVDVEVEVEVEVDVVEIDEEEVVVVVVDRESVEVDDVPSPGVGLVVPEGMEEEDVLCTCEITHALPDDRSSRTYCEEGGGVVVESPEVDEVEAAESERVGVTGEADVGALEEPSEDAVFAV